MTGTTFFSHKTIQIIRFGPLFSLETLRNKFKFKNIPLDCPVFRLLKKWYFHFLRPPTLSFCVEPPGGVAESTGYRLVKFWILQLQAYMPFVQNDEMKIFEKETATSKSDALREN